MKMTAQAIAKKIFGVRYERLAKMLAIYLIVFLGLRAADFRVQIAPAVLYLMVSSFSAGIMWQALSSEDNRENMKNMFMLPFEGRSLVFSYVTALGAYTLLTKTAGLLAVILAVSVRSAAEIFGGMLCAVNAVLVAAGIYPRKRLRAVTGTLWAGIIFAAIFLLKEPVLFFFVIAGSCLAAIVLLSMTDAYAFYFFIGKKKRSIKAHRRHSVWRYLLRYLMAHKNYLFNTAALWGVACVLPVLFGRMEHKFVLPVGFAILSLNTPLCILLSCDPALEQAVRFLPGQRKAFCVPYGLFLFACNMTADAIFLCSWQIQIGGITGAAVFAAAFFALPGASGSVLLEWYCPIRGWKIESDLWHHPRKYVVPGILLLLAGFAGTFC